MVRAKDSGISSQLFSLVPNGVPKNQQQQQQPIVEESEPQPISSPDSFSDFFKVIGECMRRELVV
jgi:hypothetical protein